MKKFKFLTLILYFVLMTTGVGYAYFSDSLTINNTVATGDMSVRFTSGEIEGLKFPEFKCSEYVLNSHINIGNDDNLFTDDNVATVKFSNMYPGSWVAFRLKAINSGTIPIKISDVNFGEFSGDVELLEYLTFEGGIGIDADGDHIIDKHISIKGKLKDIKFMFNDIFKADSIRNTQINPGGGIYFYIPEEEAPDLDKDNISDRFIVIRLKKNAPNSTQNKIFNFKLSINFKQFNIN